MPVKIHGKDYLTVAERINTFREAEPLYYLKTELISDDNMLVVMKATISDESDRVISTGYAEEIRGSSIW